MIDLKVLRHYDGDKLRWGVYLVTKGGGGSIVEIQSGLNQADAK